MPPCPTTTTGKSNCRQSLSHHYTRPYTPRTNGRAERFIQTCLREWAYARAYHHSYQRRDALPTWLHGYNWHRPHTSLAGQPLGLKAAPGPEQPHETPHLAAHHASFWASRLIELPRAGNLNPLQRCSSGTRGFSFKCRPSSRSLRGAQSR